MPRSILADAFAHHVWATIRLLDACLVLDEAQLATTVPGTFGPIIDTARHLVGGDASYLHVLSGGAVDEIDEASERTMTVGDLRGAMVANGSRWQELVAPDLDPDEIVVRRRDDGSDSLAPRGIRIAQVLHHGTDHRSQICTALTSLGIQPPEIDVWDFAEEAGRLSVITAAS